MQAYLFLASGADYLSLAGMWRKTEMRQRVMTPEQIAEAQLLYGKNGWTLRALAVQLGVSISCPWRDCDGKVSAVQESA